MVELGIFPVGTILWNKRRGDEFKAVVQIQTLPGGAREAKLSSEPDLAVGWEGGVFGSLSAFLKKAGCLITESNPEPVMARNGWTHLKLGSQQGPTLDAIRKEWKARGVEAAKQMVQAA